MPFSEQGTNLWRAARAGCVTASRFKDVLAKNKTGEAATRRDYRLQLVAERLTGTPVETYQNDAMRRGQLLEPEARMAYEVQTVGMVAESGFQYHPEIEWCGSSPDGLIDDDGMIEVKCPANPAIHLSTIIAGAIPAEHIPQVQGNLWVLERSWCDFISYDPRFPEHLRLCVYRVQRNDAYITELQAEVVKFLGEVSVLYNQLMKGNRT